MPDNFGERLRTFRKKSGLTQPELAELIGVHETTIRRWENNYSGKPGMENIKALAKALNVTEQDLLNDPPTDNSGWVLTVRMVGDCREEVLKMRIGTYDIPRSTIITDSKTGYLCLGGDYSLWTDDANFNSLIKDLKRLRFSVIQNGIEQGAVPKK